MLLSALFAKIAVEASASSSIAFNPTLLRLGDLVAAFSTGIVSGLFNS